MKVMSLALIGAASGYNMQGLRVARSALMSRRAALSKVAMDLTLEEKGEFGTTDYVMSFKEARQASRAQIPPG